MIILTATKRLALKYQRQLKNMQYDNQSVEIIQWLDWARVLLEKYCPHLIWLSVENTLMLWEKCIESYPASQAFLALQKSEHLAQQALQAWNILKYWRVIPSDLDPTLFDKENVIFLEWKKLFEQACLENHWVSDAILIETLLAQNIFQKITDKKIIYLGFDELPPQLDYFLDCCQQRGMTVTDQFESNQSFILSQPIVKLCQFENKREEYEQIAEWAYALYQEKTEKKITIVVNELEQSRALIEEIFLKKFHPDAFFKLDTENLKKDFNISLGRPFFQLPLGKTLIQISQIHLQSVLEWEAINALILNAFLVGAQKELLARATLEMHLRNIAQNEWTFEKLIDAILILQEKSATPILVEKLLLWKQLLLDRPKKQTWRAWNQWFLQLWGALISPYILNHNSDIESESTNPFNAIEMQLIICLHEQILSKLEAYALMEETVSVSFFLGYLRQLAQRVLFQPSGSQQSIQILGLLESGGLTFDYLWIMGLTANTYPPAPKPQLFLPLNLQIKYDMPHATVAREHYFATQLLTRLVRNSQVVYFSFPQQEKDESILPSPLVVNLAKTFNAKWEKIHQPKTEPVFLELEKQAYLAQLESDTQALPLNLQEHFIFEKEQKQSVLVETDHHFVSGGTTIFKLQANCPFRAFAQLRLRAVDLPLPKKIDSIRPLRGLIVHTVLENIWREVKTVEQLKKRDEHSLAQSVIKELDFVIKRNEIVHALPIQLVEIEKKQLFNLIFKWLKYEQDSHEFMGNFQILELEKTIPAHFCGFSFRVRIDRIHEVMSNKLGVVDYKTSQSEFHLTNWFDERNRLQDPQVPLYAVLISKMNQEININQVLVGKIHRAKPKWVGIYKNNDNIGVIGFRTNDQVKVMSWNTIFEYWEKALTAIGNTFREGFAPVDPHKKTTCAYCHLQILCRVQTLTKSKPIVLDIKAKDN